MSQCRSDLLKNINNCAPSNFCYIFYFFLNTSKYILKGYLIDAHFKTLIKTCVVITYQMVACTMVHILVAVVLTK